MSHADTIIVVVVLGVISLAGVAILGSLATGALDFGVTGGSEGIEPVVGETHELDDNVEEDPELLEVVATRENAVRLSDGAYISGGQGGWPSSNWSVCATGSLASDANEEATYNLLAYNNETIVVEYAGGDWQAFYEVENGTVGVNTTSTDPGSLTSVCAWWDNSSEELSLVEGDGTVVNATVGDDVPSRSVALGWDGTVDEVRLINETIDDSVSSAYASDPIDPLEGSEHAARYMLDDGAGGDTHVYYTDTSATLVDGEWTTGVEDPGLDEGADYQITIDPLAITPLSGGYLEGAPVVFVDWGTGTYAMLQTIIDGTAGAFSFVPVIMLVLLAGVLIAIVQRMR